MSFLCRFPHRLHVDPSCSLRYASRLSSIRKRSFSTAELAATTAATGLSFHADRSSGSPDAMSDFTRHLVHELRLQEASAATPELEKELRFRKRMALARSITLVESTASAHRKQADLLLTRLLDDNQDALSSPAMDMNEKFFRVGIAGPPGAGKSTFIETFGTYLLDRQPQDQQHHEEGDTTTTATSSWTPNKLAVVCIDPSSTVTGGSILGDKTRMANLSKHDRAYVRPSSNGGTFGGLSAYTHDVVSLCQAASYELVLVESVGLGQSEVEIAESVDMLVLIVPPGGGDELQGVKKGIMEVADMLIVNKADGTLLPAARHTAADYRGALQFLRPRLEGWKTPVVLTSAYTGDGVDKVFNKIEEFRQRLVETGELQQKRCRQSHYWMWKHLKDLIAKQTRDDPELRQTADRMERALNAGTMTPRVAAAQLLDSLIHNNNSA